MSEMSESQLKGGANPFDTLKMLNHVFEVNWARVNPRPPPTSGTHSYLITKASKSLLKRKKGLCVFMTIS